MKGRQSSPPMFNHLFFRASSVEENLMKQDSRPYPAAPQCFKVFIPFCHISVIVLANRRKYFSLRYSEGNTQVAFNEKRFRYSFLLFLSGSEEETWLLQNPPCESRQPLLTFCADSSSLGEVPSWLQSIKKTQLFWAHSMGLNVSAAPMETTEVRQHRGLVCILYKYKLETEQLIYNSGRGKQYLLNVGHGKKPIRRLIWTDSGTIYQIKGLF